MLNLQRRTGWILSPMIRSPAPFFLRLGRYSLEAPRPSYQTERSKHWIKVKHSTAMERVMETGVPLTLANLAYPKARAKPRNISFRQERSG
jgi:hypothetical protein